MPEILHTDNVDKADNIGTTRSTHEQFLELLCADEDLLRAELTGSSLRSGPLHRPHQSAAAALSGAPAADGSVAQRALRVQ